MSIKYHGDVILVKVNEIPNRATEVPRVNGRVVLREGEHTGHAHTIEGNTAILYRVEDAFFLKVDAPVTVVHQEHKAGVVEPGMWEVRVARERDHLSRMTRPVFD